MSNLKDNNNKTLVNKGQTRSLSTKLKNYGKTSHHSQLIDAAGKSQKITTAVYMVTDLLVVNDPLVKELRVTAVDLMNKLFSSISLSEESRIQVLTDAASLLYRLGAYLEVIYTNGNISQMNHSLLLSEISKLTGSVDVLVVKSMPYDRKKKSSPVVDEFTFTDSFFETSMGLQKDNPQESVLLKDSHSKIKDNTVLPTTKKGKERQSESQNLFRKNKGHKDQTGALEVSKTNRTETVSKMKTNLSSKTSLSKSVRHENILKILKQKSHAKIGDVSSLIKDCSSKTIQRDLNELVEKGMVSKTGDRRWSTYNLAY